MKRERHVSRSLYITPDGGHVHVLQGGRPDLAATTGLTDHTHNNIEEAIRRVMDSVADLHNTMLDLVEPLEEALEIANHRIEELETELWGEE